MTLMPSLKYLLMLDYGTAARSDGRSGIVNQESRPSNQMEVSLAQICEVVRSVYMLAGHVPKKEVWEGQRASA